MAQSCADDAQDDGCCLIVLDPKRDLADKALSVIRRRRTVWILDLAAPEIGINPLLIPGRPDAVADAVVEGFRDTNEDGAIMASWDRYLRQAAIGALVLAREEKRMPTMGDLYRLLLPHEDTMRVASPSCATPTASSRSRECSSASRCPPTPARRARRPRSRSTRRAARSR